jgi:pyrrolysine biosynthesis protein PylD
MALLTPEDLKNINMQLEEADASVRRATGLDIKEVCKALYKTRPREETIGIVPITSGNGIIGSFSESLLAIIEYFGLEGFITEMPDVSGYYQAVKDEANIILMADDNTFLAHNLENGKIANNQPCTGIIYAEIISRYLHADSKDVLALGLGRVGLPGVAHLVKKGFNVYGHDPDEKLLERAVSEFGITPYAPDTENPKKFSMIFEATPCENTIPESALAEKCLVSTPGIPCGISEELREKYDVEIVMEPLGVGTASMLYSVFD